jgi:hypothetical protein
MNQNQDTSKKMTLQTVIGDFEALESLLVEVGGETSEIVENWLAEVQHNLSVKIDSYKKFMDFLDMRSSYLRDQAKTFTASAKALETLQDSLKDRIKYTMLHLGSDEMLGGQYRFKLVTMPPKLLCDESLVPDSYRKEVITVSKVTDKEAIKSDLLGGKEVDGCSMQSVYALRAFTNKGTK